MTIVEQFNDLGLRASFHFASEVGGWRNGYKFQREALELYHENPELRAEMDQCKFIWSIKDEYQNYLRKRGCSND